MLDLPHMKGIRQERIKKEYKKPITVKLMFSQAELLNNPTAIGSVDIIPYNVKEYKSWFDGKMTTENIIQNALEREYKFKNTTWYDFFADFVMPVIGTENLILNSPVTEIDYSVTKVRITLGGGSVMEADKVMVTSSVNVLNDGVITFNPPLPEPKTTALKKYHLPGGIKGLIEFSEKFYPDYLSAATELGEVSKGNLVKQKAHIKAISTSNGKRMTPISSLPILSR